MQCSCGSSAIVERVSRKIPYQVCESCGRAEIPPRLRALHCSSVQWHNRKAPQAANLGAVVQEGLDFENDDDSTVSPPF